jgi:hypothetical protein
MALRRETAGRVCFLAGCVLALTACVEPPPPKMSSTMASNDQTASCPSDATAVGGGYEIRPAARLPGRIPVVVANRPTENGWLVQCVEPDGQPSGACKAFVLCATVLK